MIQAVGASAGVAIGKGFVLPNWEWELPEQRIGVADFAREFERVYEGIRTSKQEIELIRDELKDVVGADESTIFDAHLAILDDPVFMNEIEGIIQRQYKAAEVAVKEAIDHFVTMFDLLDDDYMKERALDIKDVGNRLLKHLLGAPEITLPSDTQPFILIAKELSPSQAAHLNPNHVLGIVTLGGSLTSHSAIMARALGIPLIVGVEGKLEEQLQTGQLIVMDGTDGKLYIDPDEEVIKRYSELQRVQNEQKHALHLIAGHKPETPDGKTLKLGANISSYKELEIALSSGAQGVGLFRTEFLYMDRSRFPKEEEQFEVYRDVAVRLDGAPLTIRTLDIGGDKQLDYFELPEEDNPFLGFRAIRISLERTDLFKTQLRAILRASHYGTVKVMYPLISSVDEVRAANAVMNEAKRELEREGKPFDKNLKIGVMIEVPAAVMIADLLAQEVDFFSIGTNDLVQFTLAVDRMNESIAHLYEPYHPSIIRMLKATVDAAKRHGTTVGVCGELAGDVKALPLWLGLDVDEISMSAHSILPVKERLLRTKQSDSRQLLPQLLECATSADIVAELMRFMANHDSTGKAS
ncbi:phosphoenolpyruvate--protein phosphotransferase [Paenibacillus protaetiae]|uniref:Phosphoenolpyruvate-protein phosphotransferase n=1 Tax=Paenibacillus protaetiae TaxID=2509456 RepID=A0A4P6F511_9BACL|nr:phosphoenolpyruvate--protein phosphotransferase [Paenibacillus protaetiae]QAY65478.1 phosphoenolpyruvate--protein phosphotransferase [Paenibacillus protaetiae]